MFVLVDVKTTYTVNFEAYVCTQTDDSYKYQNSGKADVLHFVKPIERSSRNITADNRFTSVPLIKKLTFTDGIKNKQTRIALSVFVIRKSII